MPVWIHTADSSISSYGRSIRSSSALSFWWLWCCLVSRPPRNWSKRWKCIRPFVRTQRIWPSSCTFYTVAIESIRCWTIYKHWLPRVWIEFASHGTWVCDSFDFVLQEHLDRKMKWFMRNANNGIVLWPNCYCIRQYQYQRYHWRHS